MNEAKEIDVDEWREPAIPLYNLPRNDEVRTLYYDETNNHGTVRLVDGGTNMPDPKPFVLGGIAHSGSPRPIDISLLRAAMRVKDEVKELKTEYVAWGDFPAMLGSQRLATFLSWIEAENFLIHFVAVDPIYWAIVDIVDSIPTAWQRGPEANRLLKNNLLRVVRCDLTASLDVLRRHAFPAIDPGRIRAFFDDLISIAKRTVSIDPLRRMILAEFLAEGRDLEALKMLYDEPDVLMTRFDCLFIHRICVFKHSVQIFDREENVARNLSRMRFVERGRKVDFFHFSHSHEEPGVQLSDVVVGLLGACLSWLRGMDRNAIDAFLAGLNETQENNRRALSALIDRSDAASPAFSQYVLGNDDITRFVRFLKE